MLSNEQIKLAALVEKTFNSSFEHSYNTILINSAVSLFIFPLMRLINVTALSLLMAFGQVPFMKFHIGVLPVKKDEI